MIGSIGLMVRDYHREDYRSRVPGNEHSEGAVSKDLGHSEAVAQAPKEVVEMVSKWCKRVSRDTAWEIVL